MLVAVDTNVALDLALGVGDVVDALAVIRERIAGARLIAPPTVALELAYLSEFAEEVDASRRAIRAPFTRLEMGNPAREPGGAWHRGRHCRENPRARVVAG